MKKIISILLIVCTLLSVCGCTKKNDTDDEAVLPYVDEQESEKDDFEKEQQEQTDKDQSKEDTTEQSKEQKEEQKDKEQSNTEKPKQEQNTQTDKKQENSSKDNNYNYKDEPSGSFVEREEGVIVDTSDHKVNEDFCIEGSVVNNSGFVPEEYDPFKNDSNAWLEIDFPTNDIIDCISLSDEQTHFVITKSNELYYISLSKLFSNNKHYLKVNTDLKFTKFIEIYDALDSVNYYFVSTQGNIYKTSEDIYAYKTNLEFNDVTRELNNKGIKLESISIDGHPENLLCTYKNNKIFSQEGTEVYSFQNGENIEQVFYNYVKTQKGFYKLNVYRKQGEYADSEDVYYISAELIKNSSEYRILYQYYGEVAIS